MEDKKIIRCMNCDFEGTEEDLVYCLEDESNLESGFDGCPNCKIDQYLIDHIYTIKESILKEFELDEAQHHNTKSIIERRNKKKC